MYDMYLRRNIYKGEALSERELRFLEFVFAILGGLDLFVVLMNIF